MLDNIVYVVKLLFWIFLGSLLLKLIIEVIILDSVKKRKQAKENKELADKLKQAFEDSLKEIKENNKKEK